LDQGKKPKSSGLGQGQGVVFLNSKDPFGLWEKWAEKVASFPADIHNAIMEMPAEKRRDRKKVSNDDPHWVGRKLARHRCRGSALPQDLLAHRSPAITAGH
jgi:hypothetical protein